MNGDVHIMIFGHPQYVAIVTKDIADAFFNDPVVGKVNNTTTTAEEIEEWLEDVVVLLLWNQSFDNDDIFGVRGIVAFDNDNNPPLENMKWHKCTRASSWINLWSLGYTGFCHCQLRYTINIKLLMIGFNTATTSTHFILFEHFSGGLFTQLLLTITRT
jgi:hypothetical protein